MGLGHFMWLALSHPQYGYYMKKDPFGRKGDFVTAPEISQMFGEILGAWLRACWQLLGAPTKCHLLELGPGRGTLMADILRVAQKYPDFYHSLSLHLMETSPVLSARQKQTLASHQIQWHQNMATLPDTAPLLVVCNEFFDALPIEQLTLTRKGWQQRYIGLTADKTALTFIDLAATADLVATLCEPQSQKPKAGDIYEISPIALDIAGELAQRIAKQKGIGLWIDYGPEKIRPGDSLQGVKSHLYHPVLENVGDVDLTAHVAFARLAHVVQRKGAYAYALTTQGNFLQQCGIHQRAMGLKKHQSPHGRAMIDQALERLCDDHAMGDLFKCFALSHDGTILLPSFSGPYPLVAFPPDG